MVLGDKHWHAGNATTVFLLQVLPLGTSVWCDCCVLAWLNLDPARGGDSHVSAASVSLPSSFVLCVCLVVVDAVWSMRTDGSHEDEQALPDVCGQGPTSGKLFSSDLVLIQWSLVYLNTNGRCG